MLSPWIFTVDSVSQSFRSFATETSTTVHHGSLVERGTAAKRTRAELFSDRLGWALHRDVDDGKQSQTEGVIALRRTPFGDRGVRIERAQWIPSALKHPQIRGVSFD